MVKDSYPFGIGNLCGPKLTNVTVHIITNTRYSVIVLLRSIVMGDFYDPIAPPEGPQLLDEPDFDAEGDWHPLAGWSVPGDGYAYADSEYSGAEMYQYFSGLVGGVDFFLFVDIIAISGTLRFSLGNGASKSISTTGLHQLTLVPAIASGPCRITTYGAWVTAQLDFVQVYDSRNYGQTLQKWMDEWNFMPHGTRYYETITDEEDKQCFRACSVEDFSHCDVLIEY